MTPTDNDDNAPEGAQAPPSREEERLLRAVAQLPPEKKRRLLERLIQSEIITRPKKPEGEEPE
jgi:hypothetical protein